MPASDLRVRNTKAPEGASGKPKLVGSGGSMVAKLKNVEVPDLAIRLDLQLSFA